ncbi:hypothetical protein [Cellulophaga sp. L1A9]|uniref:hypothetical protein n=1 Tax=Cellulophaga sp. L1A9 TaxID=2686362 RepID=UPI00131C1280|nr:hypothetical protein [Cellulophaga sp. L1A9]
MKFFSNRPKSDFVENDNWQKLYILTEHWKSDLLFYKDDLKFLRHLEDKYFLWIEAQTDLENIRKVGESILKDTRDCDDLLERVDKHLVHLSVLMSTKDNDNQKEFRTEHMELEEAIFQFIENMRGNRRQLFKVIEFDVETAKL